MPPPRGTGIGEPTEGRRRERLEQHPGDAMPEPHATPLGGIVEERRAEEVRIVVSTTQQLLGHVEPVAPIRDRHRCEERDSADRQDAVDQRLLLGIDPRADVGNELPDPMHR